VIWGDDGVPRSRQFGDVYYSTADGLAESRAVFLAGCGLPEAWRGRPTFVVGELGFGSGLNILALIDLWRRTREPGARLNLFSLEAFPISAEDARRALGLWPEIADLAEILLAQWPRRARGFHRIDFEACGAVLDLAVMDAAEALAAWTGAADAWFLDGFSPARNPGMWTPEVLGAVAARSAPGARAATFTVAGAVRRGLAEAGFAVEKRPGFGRKAERLEAKWPGAPETETSAPPRIAIVGAGIAGAALCRAFHAAGLRPLALEAEASGAGASGNPAALVMPRLDAGGGPVAQLYVQALARAADLYDRIPEAVIARSALQLETEPKDPNRFDRIAVDPAFEPGAMERLTPARMSDALGEDVSAGGLRIRDARVVDPAVVLAEWLAGAAITRAQVQRIERSGDAWRLLDETGAEIARADIICIASGPAAAQLAPDLPLAPVRGQVGLREPADPPGAAIGGGYAIPTRSGFLFGATHDRGDDGVEVRAEDHARNRDLLAEVRPGLASSLDLESLTGRAGVRAVTPDFLPLAGPVPGAAPRLFILSGLGSRGFCAAPLLAEHVAALALGRPSPLPHTLAEIIDPARFDRRRDRRLGRSMGRTSAKTNDRAEQEAPI
jgi:tRNA 5-methylaminomethyl-2-thiouridine biosynthesis bifunctional protein